MVVVEFIFDLLQQSSQLLLIVLQILNLLISAHNLPLVLLDYGLLPLLPHPQLRLQFLFHSDYVTQVRLQQRDVIHCSL